MAVELQVVEHTVPKTTRWGTVQKSLNQHIVRIKNDEGLFVHCGYVGVSDFLPLSGFPRELCEEVAAVCSKELNRKVGFQNPPPSITEINAMAAAQESSDDE